jgi:hypothetical protein
LVLCLKTLQVAEMRGDSLSDVRRELEETWLEFSYLDNSGGRKSWSIRAMNWLPRWRRRRTNWFGPSRKLRLLSGRPAARSRQAATVDARLWARLLKPHARNMSSEQKMAVAERLAARRAAKNAEDAA